MRYIIRKLIAFVHAFNPNAINPRRGEAVSGCLAFLMLLLSVVLFFVRDDGLAYVVCLVALLILYYNKRETIRNNYDEY